MVKRLDQSGAILISTKGGEVIFSIGSVEDAKSRMDQMLEMVSTLEETDQKEVEIAAGVIAVQKLMECLARV